MEEIIREMRRLEAEIEYHSKKYYDEDSPEITDREWDMLLERLKELEAVNPELASPSSPTHRVGGHVSERFEKVTHEVFMGSMNDVFDIPSLVEFGEKIDKEFPGTEYVVESKIDGLSVALEYSGGIFIRGATRGNGEVGEDVTVNLKTVRNIPLVLSGDYPDRLIVRGEVYMPKQVFAELNKKRDEEGLAPFANPRNAAAGSLRQLDSRLCAERKLDIFIFNLQLSDGDILPTHSETLSMLESLGFKVSPAYKICKNIEEAVERVNELGIIRKGFDFDTDGAVIKVNSLAAREELGYAGALPKWAAAYKYAPETAETIVKDITVQVGRTGVLTPKAVLEPVSIAGSTVGFATLHNIDYIKEKDIRIGDSVVIHKAGDIIPEVVSVNTEKRTGKPPEYELPSDCPSCGMPVVREEDEAAVRCTNAGCPAQLHRNIVHFVSRNAMNIEKLGETHILRLTQTGMVKSAADLYSLEADALESVERLGKKSASGILESIERSKKNPLSRLLYALGIRHTGEKTAKILAQSFGTMEKLMEAGHDELCVINEIGPETAESVINYFENPSNREVISRLAGCGVRMDEDVAEKGTALEGLTVVVTGTLPTLGRKEAEALVIANGGKASGSVSKKTSLLLCGQNPGSKRDKAAELGIKIIDEEEFLNIINKGN